MESTISFDPLLSASDPSAVELYNSRASAPVLLLCEHAGNHVPEKLQNLGLDEEGLTSHVAWDIGARQLARGLSDRLNAPLILQRYSRLVIDCNRPPGATGSFCETSDGIVVPGNANLHKDAQAERQKAIFDPLDRAITDTLGGRSFVAAFSIHTFTRTFDGQTRPWHAGFLSRKDTDMAEGLIQNINAQDPDLTLAQNEPYQIEDASDWFIPRHAEPRGLRHSLIEIRNELVNDKPGQDRWADLLAGAIQTVLEGHL